MIRSLGGKNIPVYILQSSVAVSLLFFSGPEHLGGNGNLKEKLMRIDAKDDITRNLEIEKVKSNHARDTRSYLNSRNRLTVDVMGNYFLYPGCHLCMITSFTPKRYASILLHYLAIFINIFPERPPYL